MVVNLQVDNTSKLAYIVYLSNHILHYMYLDEVDTLDDVDTDDDVERELDVDTLETKRRPQINIFQKIVFSMSSAIFIRKKDTQITWNKYILITLEGVDTPDDVDTQDNVEYELEVETNKGNN